MPYPYLAEMQHSFVIGANGTGKTILISQIVEQIRERGDKAIIYDKKGDYTKWFYNPKKDKILIVGERNYKYFHKLNFTQKIYDSFRLETTF